MFGKQKETKEEKQARKEQELLERYGLQELSDPQDVASVRKIAQELTGTGLMETGNDRRGRNDRTHLFNRRLTSDCTAA